MDARSEAFQLPLTAERIRNARRGALLRLLGISSFLALHLVLGVVLEMPLWQRHLGLFSGYWLIAVTLFVLTRSVPRLWRGVSLAIPLIDMPMVFLIVRRILPLVESGVPHGPATFALGVYAWFIVNAALSLEHWQTVLTAAVGSVLAVWLQYLVGAPVEVYVMCVIVLGFTAVTCIYASERATRLVDEVSSAELRRECLSRYFSPDVARLLEQRGDQSGGGRELRRDRPLQRYPGLHRVE